MDRNGAPSRSARLALDQGDVVLPVVVDPITLEAAPVAGDLGLADHHGQFEGIHAQAGDGVGVFARHAVAVALEATSAVELTRTGRSM